MKRFCVIVLAIFVFRSLLFVVSPAFAASSPVSSDNIAATSDPFSDKSPEMGEDKAVNIPEFLVNVLGSGLTCALFTQIFDRSKEKKLRLLSTAEAVFVAFNATFAGDFLERNNNNLDIFRKQYTNFCQNQNFRIRLLAKNKDGKIFIQNLGIDSLIAEARKEITSSDYRAQESAIREYVGKQYSEFVAQISGIK